VIQAVRARDGVGQRTCRHGVSGRVKASGERTMGNIRAHLIIEGRVQGVWFRESTRREAVSLKLSGWVRNRPDGSVEALIEGPENEVEKLISWCQKGPPAAKVTRTHRKNDKWQGEFNSFDIVF